MGGLQGSRWSCRHSQLLQLNQKWSRSLPVIDWSPVTLLGGGELSRDGDRNWWAVFGHKKPFPWRGLWGIGLLSLFASRPLWAEQLAPTMDSPPQLLPYDRPESFGANLRVKPPTLWHCGPKWISFRFHQPILSGLVTEGQHGAWKEDVEAGCKTSSGRKQTYESAHLQTRAILHEEE